jgi:hypothetical protein
MRSQAQAASVIAVAVALTSLATLGGWVGAGWLGAATTGAFASIVAYQGTRAILSSLVEAGSIRAAKRALRTAVVAHQHHGSRWRVRRAKLHLAFVRWQRK